METTPNIVTLASILKQRVDEIGINANALAPRFFPSELTGSVFGDPDWAACFVTQTFIGCNDVLEDLVGPALSLCADASAYVTGQVLCVHGGSPRNEGACLHRAQGAGVS